MLELDWRTILFQMINFAALLAGVSFLVIKPLRSKLSERRRNVAEMYANAREQEAKANLLRDQWEDKMRGAEEDAEEIRGEARLASQRRTEEMMQQARRKFDRLTLEMQESLTRQRDELLADQFDDILQAVIDVSGRVVQLVTTRRTHDDLVTNFNATIRRSPLDQVTKYRNAMAGRAPIAFITTPTPLTPEQSRALLDSLSALLDRHVELDLRVDTALIAGLQVRIADTLFDNSIQSRLDQVRNQARIDLVQRLQMETPNE